MKSTDVYAFGMISSSVLHLLSKPFPAPDGYAEIESSHRMTGGEACNSAIVLTRLGLRACLDGAWIGDTPDGIWLLETLNGFGIDTSPLRVEPSYGGVREIVFSDEHSRSIFGNYIHVVFTTRQWNIPRSEDIAAARLACIDPFFGKESQLAGQYARQLNVPYVTIDCPFDDTLAQNAAALILSGEFRQREYPNTGEDEERLLALFAEYQQRANGLVIFTCGSEKVIYGRKDQATQCFPAYRVRAIDTAGAGDSFRSGVVYGLLQGWNDLETVRYASALAAILCTRFPGVLNCPTHAEVMQFIQEHSSCSI